MSPKKGKSLPEQEELEYKLSEEEFGDELGEQQQQQPSYQSPPPEPKPKRSFWSRLSRKNIMLGIVIVVVIIALYQLLTHQEQSALQAGAPQVLEAAKPPAKPSTPVTPPPSKPVAVAPEEKPQPAPPPAITVLAPVTPQEEKQLGAYATKQVSELQTGLTQAEQAIQELRSGMSSISAQLQALSTLVQEVACNPGAICKIESAAPLIKPQAAKKPHKKGPPPLVYHVKALIPGRAWLESNKGTTTSVKVGDRLRNYGVVTSIDPNTGFVDTSSGTVIKYGKYDS